MDLHKTWTWNQAKGGEGASEVSILQKWMMANLFHDHHLPGSAASCRGLFLDLEDRGMVILRAYSHLWKLHLSLLFQALHQQYCEPKHLKFQCSYWPEGPAKG